MQIHETLYNKPGRVRYDLRTDTGEFVARFDSLGDAARVARYITGANMGEDERRRAIDAMNDAQVARTLGRTLNAAKKNRKRATVNDGQVAAVDAEQTNDELIKGI